MDDKTNEHFERLWQEQGYKLLHDDAEYQKIAAGYKISSGADLLLFGFPVVVGVVFLDHVPIERELLRWLASAGVTVAVFVVCVWIKSLISGTKSVAEVEREVKARCYKHYCEHGTLQ